ncbi:MAG: O-acetylhomoserine aminocarboxypropyltransferase/cysteine synthase [Spirochaetales bacterium]|nr:O-acetylhomoserine aminocarboxypropyltransferase/cysteine synthase [Spirochaetales bacterium]
MDTYHFETKALHVGQERPESATGSRTVPIYQTTSFVFEDSVDAEERFALRRSGHIYTRLNNPTQDAFEARIAALEGGVGALAVASGMAAISYAILALAKQGDHIVSAKTIYGGTYNLFAHTLVEWGITTTFVDPCDLKEVAEAIGANTKALFIETIGNPNATLCDIEALAKIAHDHRIPIIVDNTFASPYLLRPIEHGADIVVHSATKFLGGHGTSLGGVIVDGGTFDWRASGKFPSLVEPNPSYHGFSFTEQAQDAAYITKIRTLLLRDTGAAIAPLNAWLFLLGLETLALRVQRHGENTSKVIAYLQNHPKVRKINHPSIPTHPQHHLYRRYFPDGGISIFTIELVGGGETARSFIDSLKLFSLLANVADMKSLVIHPASTTHAQLGDEEKEEQGISESTIRLSIGCEHADDIISDLEQALGGV